MSDGEPLLTAKKYAAYIQVSEEMLMECGVIPDTREHKPIPWRTRLRWRLADSRVRAAEVAYRLIAGDDVPACDE